VMSMANSLMLDFRCLIIPRFVYATRNDFDDQAPAEDIKGRVAMLAQASLAIKNSV
jgi:hypothetical protein